MKNPYNCLLVWALMISPFVMHAQVTESTDRSKSEFSGIITYEITLSGDGVTESMKYMIPKTMYLSIKGNKARKDMGASGVGIVDGDARETIMFIYLSGQDIAIKSTMDDIARVMENEPKTRLYVTGETMDILGYTCKKARIVYMGEDRQLIAYFTPELGGRALNFANHLYKDIDGVLLEYEEPYEEGGWSMHFKAISIEKKIIDDSQFTIPEGCIIKTPEEIKEMY